MLGAQLSTRHSRNIQTYRWIRTKIPHHLPSGRQPLAEDVCNRWFHSGDIIHNHALWATLEHIAVSTRWLSEEQNTLMLRWVWRVHLQRYLHSRAWGLNPPEQMQVIVNTTYGSLRDIAIHAPFRLSLQRHFIKSRQKAPAANQQQYQTHNYKL